MNINHRWTSGLAWAGLAIVLAVPSADFIAARLVSGESADTGSLVMAAANDGGPRSATPEIAGSTEIAANTAAPTPLEKRPSPPVATDPITTAAVDKADVVDTYLKSGKPLPAYLTEAGATPPSPAPAVPQPVVTPPPTAPKVAAVAPAAPLVAPEPMPASMRPKMPVTAAPAKSPASADRPVIVAGPSNPAYVPPPRAIDDEVILPPAPVRDFGGSDDDIVMPPGFVGGDDYDAYDDFDRRDDRRDRRLSDYLADRGLLSDDDTTSDYDEDGFFLSDGPNSERRSRVWLFSR